MSHPEVLIDSIYGNCPVQAEGTIDGFHFYFRARGESWSLSIANGKSTDPLEEDGWHYSERYGDSQFAAGWMEEAEALKFIHEAAERFHANPVVNVSVEAALNVLKKATAEQSSAIGKEFADGFWDRVGITRPIKSFSEPMRIPLQHQSEDDNES